MIKLYEVNVYERETEFCILGKSEKHPIFGSLVYGWFLIVYIPTKEERLYGGRVYFRGWISSWLPKKWTL